MNINKKHLARGYCQSNEIYRYGKSCLAKKFFCTIIFKVKAP